MRTTLEIDDTVLAAARSLARARGISIGAAVSELARRGIGAAPEGVATGYSPFPVLHGEPGHIVTEELVDRFRDDD